MSKLKIKSRRFGFSKRPALIGVLAAVILALAGCASFNTYTTESRPLTQPITIDGRTDDWQGELFVVPGERMMIGFVNDGHFLYVAVLVEEAFQRNLVLYQGLTVWFDPKGGKEKAFGIRYPLGLPPGERPAPKMGAEGEGLTPVDLPEGALAELEIIRSEKEPPQRIRVADLKGVEVKVTPSTGLLVYEMKIPLAADADHPVAVGTLPGRTVGIGFETPKFDASSIPRNSGGGMPGGGGGRGGGGGGGGRGGMGGGGGMGGRGGMMGLAEPLKIWAIVQLAPGKGVAPADVRSMAKIPD
jgi:uncharacterized membrane protein YgcG